MNGGKINGRTPEEIKRSLKCRAMWGTPDCKMKCDECGTYVPGLNGSIMAAAALDLIQQFERERDAAVVQLKEVDKEGLFRCSHCIHDELCNDGLTSCVDCDKECPCHTCRNSSNWQWRGVQNDG